MNFTLFRCTYRLLAAALVCLTFLVAVVQRVTALDNNQVAVTLKSSTPQLASGTPFSLSVHFAIADGWHIYWKEPGDAGRPTQISWELPSGFTAGELSWPPHITFKQPGNIIGYGYEKEVELTSQVTPPSNLQPGTTVQVAAKVKWLACADVCVPGSKVLSMELPVR